MVSDKAPDYLFEKFKHFYKDLKQSGPVKLHNLYDDKVIFKDPLHELQGLDQLAAYFEASSSNLTHCQFEFLDELITDNRAYIKWHMHFHHPKISKETLTVRGMTHLIYADKITYHEDIYDLGSMVYEHLPVVGKLVRLIKRKIMSNTVPQ